MYDCLELSSLQHTVARLFIHLPVRGQLLIFV